MKILNFGSLNIDHVYTVDHFTRPGETISSMDYQLFCGGKGLNQSIALSFAGADVYHAGKIGQDGKMLLDILQRCGVNTQHIKTDSGPSGHAIIQVSTSGENCILLHSGANEKITEQEIKDVLEHFSEGDYLLLQNEINHIALIMEVAHSKGLKIIFNPAPMYTKIATYPLELVDIFLVNEIEGKDLTGCTDPDHILKEMHRRFPTAEVVLTLGANGVTYTDGHTYLYEPALTTTHVVDTTAAGDTFIGYFLANQSAGMKVEDCLKVATKASALCISRPGASSSIPRREEVL